MTFFGIGLSIRAEQTGAPPAGAAGTAIPVPGQISR